MQYRILLRGRALAAAVFGLSLLLSSTGWSQDALMREAQSALQAERFEDAAKAFSKIVEEDEDNADATFLLGYALHMGGEIEKALEVHQRAAKFESYKPIATYNVGCAYALLGKPEKALDSLEAALDYGFAQGEQFDSDSDLDSLRVTSRFAVLLANVHEDGELAESLMKADRLLMDQNIEAAAEIYQELVSEHKDNGFVLYRNGFTLHALGKLDKAIEFHKRAAEQKPFSAIALYNLGCALALKEQPNEALAALEKAIDAGFSQADYMVEDPDLGSLQENEKFVSLLTRIRESKKNHNEDH